MKLYIDGKLVNKGSGGGAVKSVNGQTGDVVLTATDIEGVEQTANKVTSMSSLSTDIEYPSAKSVYTVVGDVESILENINDGTQVSTASIRKVRSVKSIEIEPEDIKEEHPAKEKEEVKEIEEIEEIPEQVKEYVEEKKSKLATIKDWFLKPWRKKNEHSNRAEQVG